MSKLFIHNIVFRICAGPIFGVLVYLIILMINNTLADVNELFSASELFAPIVLSYLAFESMRWVIARIERSAIATKPIQQRAIIQVFATLAVSVLLVPRETVPPLPELTASALTDAFASQPERIIRTLSREGSMAILLVEQNAHMALQVAQHFYLIEQGLVSFSGTPGELAEDDVVQRAYLGAVARHSCWMASLWYETKAIALVQCAARSNGVKRSILRPVSGTWPPSAPLRQ